MNAKKLVIPGVFSFLLAGVAKAAPLVPCGGPDDPCKMCDLFVLLDNIFDFVFFDIVPPLAVIVFVIGGVYLFFSRGDPTATGKASRILTTAVIGLVIIYGAFILIGVFFTAIGVAEGEFGTNIKNWFEYPCQ